MYKCIMLVSFWVLLESCVSPVSVKREDNSTPSSYRSSSVAFQSSKDSVNIAKINWKKYFDDANLIALIDTALRKNQELNIAWQEINISRNEVRARKGEYLPFVGLRAGAGVEKEGEFTRPGAVEENIEIEEGRAFPKPLPDYMLGAYASWELDVWKKLRNAKKGAALRYLASVEGRNFTITNLIAEIASSYYELVALDNMLEIVQKNINVQKDALEIVRQQKAAAKTTQLAVNRFEAQLLNTTSLQFEIKQRIVETENRIHFLAGGFSQSIPRDHAALTRIFTDSIYAGIPSQLLVNRPDIRQAELDLAAAKLDVKVARANFYPSFSIVAGTGFHAFDAKYLIKPESIFYSLAGDLIAPLVNRNAIKAAYYSANSRQLQAVYNYERTILNAYLEVQNQLSGIENFTNSFETKSKEVDILMQSIDISNSLFRSARADYLEVLLTQREALESKMDLFEIKMRQVNAKVNIYKALGGGWNQ
jgi:multidrug efflux system outer membrane protein